MAGGGAYKIKLKKVEARVRTSFTVVTAASPLHGGGGWGLVIKKRREGGRTVILACRGALPVVVGGD